MLEIIQNKEEAEAMENVMDNAKEAAEGILADIEEGVVTGYKKIEDGVVGTYRKIEHTAYLGEEEINLTSREFSLL